MRELNVPTIIKERISFIEASVTNAGFSRLVVAVSGGIDSATATALAAAALGPENVFALLLPYKDWHAAATRQARQLLRHLKIPTGNVFEVDITPIVEVFLQSVNLRLRTVENNTAEADLDTVRAGNIMARVRMVLLFDYARKLNTLVLGTENKTEHYLGYYTRFGDEASDIEPLRNLYKTEIYQLAEYLKIPREIQGGGADGGALVWTDR